MAKVRDWYCGGYGGIHLIPGQTRRWFVCSRCRWNPNQCDSAEKKKLFEKVK